MGVLGDIIYMYRYISIRHSLY